MGEMTIKTNHHWREFTYRSDVPADILKSEFDWTDEEDDVDGFFCYRDCWYHLNLFMRGAPEGWDGAHGDSYFSGTLIKLSDDGETFQVGTYYC